ncbi:hypothetical protein BCV69DRAFT_279438 [Microstroma glucosiphilum]|uniref:Lysophospholipase NTE1 n=1 Tax=Pseudomicrostroma glucosiphilum TaxID=1684307 RepID=A0A316UE61_9BASI|nr:hypothetical protein BCV69DRAFT_279438 [Pseudomicrostroma glucosiphilum]PWN23509.1 hypothetical protein BCV69DRAFT_279438 [Pseudomicrostroma glucosiphilum]
MENPVVAAASLASVASAAALASSSATPSTAHHPPPSPRDRSITPLLTLIDGFTSIFIALFGLARSLLSFATVTIPHAGFTILHYSLTLQLNFLSLLVLFLAAVLAVLLWLRYRHRSYERLKEVPLKTDDGFNLHPELNAGTPDTKSSTFHSYLDEFLQAIRVFGFLEKPVFHDLARHLQTRRLLAGDSLSLDSDFSFYIVIDGKVQVFAPLPPESAAKESGFDDEENTGYQLLNEVENGGTLSSLFTILSLFTEDVQLGYREEGLPGEAPPPPQPMSASAEGLRRRASLLRPGSEQLQLNAAALRNIPNAGDHSLDQINGLRRISDLQPPPSVGESDFPLQSGPDSRPSPPFPADSSPRVTGRGSGSSERGLSPVPQELLPPAQAAVPFNSFPTSPNRTRSASARGQGRMESPVFSAYRKAGSNGRPHTPGSVLSGYSMQTNRGISMAPPPLSSMGTATGRPSDTLHFEGAGTVGRAVVDTTLAVIPAEAFKRLTKKYPNSAAHIVQVILTRLSRVTFHTAHKYLGLTKEIMRTEKRINEVASFPLPSIFYEQGGMEKLRQRFLPEPVKQGSTGSTAAAAAAAAAAKRGSEDDYFRHGAVTATQKSGSGKGNVPSTPWGHPDPPLRTPFPRTSVGPGDLLSMTGDHDMGRSGSPHSVGASISTMRSPPNKHSSIAGAGGRSMGAGSPDTLMNASDDGRPSLGQRIGSTLGSIPNFDLKDEILDCISKAIGIQASQPPSPHFGGGYEPSPFIHPQDASLHRNSVFNSAFGSLSMLDGMMYEDETSSITGASSFAGVHHAELENEVEVRFFPKGSLLAKAGESHAGLFYVIDGFLDVIVPPEVKAEFEVLPTEQSSKSSAATKKRAEQARGPATTMAKLNREMGGAEGGVGGTGRSGSGSGTSSKRGSRANSISSTTPRKSTAVPTHSAIGNSLDGSHHNAGSRSREPAEPLRSGAMGSKSMGPLPEDASKKPKRDVPPSQQRPIYSVGRGGVAGYLSSLLATASYVDIRAKTDVYVGYLPAKALERIMEQKPIVLLTLSKRLLSLLSPLIIHIDSALDWQQVSAGQVIFREGDPSDSFYIVINGRLRAISDRDGSVDVLSEYGQGDSVGELDVITSSPRRKTLHAIRDSELARMPMTLFNAVAVRHPQITIQISRIIARRVTQEMKDRQATAHVLRHQVPGLPDLGRNNANLRTVAIVPVTREVPITEFANKVQSAFEDTIGGPTSFLNQSSVMSVLGRHAFNRMGKLKLASWLSEQEQKHRLVLYVVDTAVSSPWAQTSIRQADTVLLVGFGDDPAVGEYERLLVSVKTTARKELVLLHPERSVPPGSTRAWLEPRPWINAHHHVEMPGITRSRAAPMTTDPTAVKALRNLKERLESGLQRYRVKGSAANVGGRAHHYSDFARLARRLCGKSIGLVLGGGGARGCAHVGVVQALEERGIPIDMIGGTSIGSLIGGLYAKEGEVVSSYGRVKKFSGRMASLWRMATDVTYPLVSWTTGHEFNRGIFKALSNTHIEDMWLPFFCNTTNITWSRMEVHTSGYAWRYIRASMTLAGLIPPLVDDGQMLVDGGYVDNLPVSVMVAMGAQSIFAVDVGSIDDTSPRSYGDTLSGWWVLINKWNPWSDARNIPSIPDIQGRLTYVSSVKTLEEAKRIPGCRYMRMPVEGFGTLEFGKFEEISRIGYAAASKMLADWAEEGLLPTGNEGDAEEVMERRRRKGGISARRNSV